MADINNDGIDENIQHVCSVLVGISALICGNILAYVYDGEYLKIMIGCDILIIGSYLKVSVDKYFAKKA